MCLPSSCLSVSLSEWPTKSLNPNWLGWNLKARVPQAAGSNYFTASQYQRHAGTVGGVGWGHMVGHTGEEVWGDKRVSCYWLSFICLNRDVGAALCRLIIWMTSWLFWQFSRGRLEFVGRLKHCVSSLTFCHSAIPHEPPFLAEAPQPFSLLAARLLPSSFLCRTNEWGFLVNVFQTTDIIFSVAGQFEAGN